MNNFFKKIKFLKEKYFNDSSIVEIGETIILYLKNKDLLNCLDLNDKEFSDSNVTKTEAENINNLDTQNQQVQLEGQQLEVNILWKYLKRLFSKEELEKMDESSVYEVYIYLNYKIGEMIISRVSQASICLEEDWSEIKREILKKDSLLIFLMLPENENLINDIKYDIKYDKDLNLIHVLFQQINEKEEN